MATLHITTKRMYILMDYAINNKLVSNIEEWYERIGAQYTASTKLKTGVQRFTVDQITACCVLTGANMNWVCDIERMQWRERKNKSALQLLNEAVSAVSQELKKTKVNVVALN